MARRRAHRRDTHPTLTPEAYRRTVLDLVASIPPGQVLSYGAIAAHLAEVSGRASPRLVGQIMARCDEPVPWHRVVRSDGRPAPGHEAEALRLLQRDGTPLRGIRVDMARAAWSPERPPGSPLTTPMTPAAPGRPQPA